MNSYYLENIKCPTSYHLLNHIKNYKLNDSILDNKNYLQTNFSQLGYQIMNPQFISYTIEPIFSSASTIDLTNSYSFRNTPKIEIGKPVERNNSQINQRYSFSYKYDDTLSPTNNYRYKSTTGKAHISDTQLILDAINNLELKSKYSRNNTCSTNDLTKLKYENPNNNSKNKKNERKSNDQFYNNQPGLRQSQHVSPFIKFLRESSDYKRKSLEEETNINKKLKGSEYMSKKMLLKKRTKRNWLALFKQFIHLYAFFSSSRKYSSINGRTRNNLIYIRTKHIVNDIAILKNWIISIEESFFNEFRNYEEFNSRLNLKIQGEKKQIFKNNILNIIKLFINNLESDLEEIPPDVQSTLFEYIKNACYFPKKYLSKFQINRLDFNFYGSTKNITICQCAMILAYLIINGVCVQQILLHLRDVFSEFSDCDDIESAIRNIGSILHYLVRDIFKKKQKKINDILALFNYYRNYHLYNEQIEKLKDKINNKINIEENDKDDEYIGLLLPYKEVKEFFDENTKSVEEFKDDIFNWSIELAKNIKNKFTENDNFSSSKKKKRKIKSSIYG